MGEKKNNIDSDGKMILLLLVNTVKTIPRIRKHLHHSWNSWKQKWRDRWNEKRITAQQSWKFGYHDFLIIIVTGYHFRLVGSTGVVNLLPPFSRFQFVYKYTTLACQRTTDELSKTLWRNLSFLPPYRWKYQQCTTLVLLFDVRSIASIRVSIYC